MRYRKKPVVIEAKEWRGTPRDATPIIQWIHDEGGQATLYWPNPGDPECPEKPAHELRHYCPSCDYTDTEPAIAIVTLEGTMRATPFDWVIRGVQGEFYPCKSEIFYETYEVA